MKEVLAGENQTCDEVSIYFVETEEICSLHQTYFDDPSPTDCISFPLDDENEFGYRILGEVFVCPATALLYAQKKSIDPYEEISLYIIHGLLHLIGYDDIEKKDRVQMRKAEARQMDRIKKLNLSLKPSIE